MLVDNTRLYIFLNREKIDSIQAGSSAAASPDWSGENNDVVDTAGIGLKHTLIKDKLDIGADYSVSHSRGEVHVEAGVTAPAFPDVTSNSGSVKLYATYQLKGNISLRGAYWYEHYDSANWE